MKKIFLIGYIIIGFQFINAKDAYDITFDSIYMANKIYYSLDKELNRVFVKLKKKLSYKGKRILIKSQKRWIKSRNYKCAFPETNSVNIGCAIEETKNRLHFLEDRLRECEEIGCKIDRL